MSDLPPTGAGPRRRFSPLDAIEWIGNKLPDPATLFLLGAVLVMVLSHVGEVQGWKVEKPIVRPVTAPVLNPETGEPITVFRFTEQGRVKVLETETDAQGDTLPRATEVVSAEYRIETKEDGAQIARLVTEPGTEAVVATSLLDRDGFRWVLDNLVTNFTSFHPLGVVLVAMLGIGVAEKTGMIGALLKAMMLITPGRLLTPAMVFIGIMSSMAADAGYVVLPPIAAALYKAVGRSPLAGLAAVFAGVSAGFSANLLITSLDPLLAGLSQEGAQILEPGYYVNPACNWYFMIASTVLLTAVGWGVTSRFVEPRFARKPADEGGPSALTAEDRDARNIAPGELRALGWSGVCLGVALALSLALIFVPGAPLYAAPGQPPRWGNAIVPLIFFLFLVPGVAYGIVAGTIVEQSHEGRLDAGIARLMSRTMADMGPYIVLAFFAAQFVEFFNHSNLGVMLAIVGGEFLAGADLPPWLLLALFIVVAGLGNLFIGSASAKYAFFAPVFVPMFMQVGISPELTQAAYRVGDSVTNIIAPLNPYLIVILVFMRKYVPKAGIGTLISLMLPYALTFWAIWTIMIIVWILLGIPLGPEGPLFVEPPAAT